MKNGLCLLILSLLLACSCLMENTLPAFAASRHAAIVATRIEQVVPTYKWKTRTRYHSRSWWWHVSHGGSPAPEINQFHEGNSGFNNPIYSVGHDIGNTGNSGHNRGHNEDNDTNSGNQLMATSHLRGFHRVNQYYYGNSNYNNPIHHWGYNQANDGNSGVNDGLNQDNNTNSGNQIIG